MNDRASPAGEFLHAIGAFDPSDAKKIITALESEHIYFEVESDHSELAKPRRFVFHYLGMFPDGSKLVIFVPASSVPQAERIVRTLYPL